MYYQEYQEALSRLEAPERPYQVQYISRYPHMAYPDHTTDAEWENVFQSGKNNKLPKYSISQRVCINEADLGKEVYEFDLDKTFTTAVGDRKSIAIRAINFVSPGRTGEFGNFSGDITVFKDYGYKDKDGNDKILDYNKNSYEFNVVAKSPKDIQAYFSNAIYNVMKIVFGDDVVSEPVNDYDKQTTTIILQQITKSEKVFPFLKFGGCFDNLSAQTMLFGRKNSLNIKPEITYDTNTTLKYQFNIIDFHIPASVCSTINPYSVQNIIGALKEEHDMLNKMYPYDRQNTFQLWFNDCEGNRIKNDFTTGYMDLELIVDSSNNINLYV